MQTFCPFGDHRENAKVIDTNRLNSQILESRVILNSLAGVYKPKKRSPDRSGWEGHPVVEMWRFHELQLARRTLALAEERLKRPMKTKEKGAIRAALLRRRATVKEWKNRVHDMDEGGFEDTIFSMWGDEDFHSAFRSLLLWKGLEYHTFLLFKKKFYDVKHPAISGLPKTKKHWHRKMYEDIWYHFGRPSSLWYERFNWKEEPNPDLVFYRKDRVTIKEGYKNKPIPLGVVKPERANMTIKKKERPE